eukprot:1176729-Prorocentrum_minimum.AAC.4
MSVLVSASQCVSICCAQYSSVCRYVVHNDLNGQSMGLVLLSQDTLSLGTSLYGTRLAQPGHGMYLPSLGMRRAKCKGLGLWLSRP